MNPILMDLVKETDVNEIENINQFYTLTDAIVRKERMDYIQIIKFNTYLYDKWVKSKMN